MLRARAAVASLVLTLGLVGCGTPAKDVEVIVPPTQDPVTAADESFRKGLEHYSHGHFKKALTAFQWTLRNDPLRYEAHFWSGVCYYQLEEYGLEVVEYSLCHALNPNFPSVWRNLGDAYFAMDDLAAARKAYTTFLRWEPDFAPVILNFALIELDLGDVQNASALFRKYLELEERTSNGERRAQQGLREIDTFLRAG